MINESVENMLYNYKYILGKLLAVKDKMRGSFESDFGIERTTPYSVEYAQLDDERQKYEGMLSELKNAILRETIVKSVELAEEFAKFLTAEENEQYRVFDRTFDGLTYLCVAKKSDVRTLKKKVNPEDEYIIDVDRVITRESKRGLFDKNKIIGDKVIPIKCFLPKDYTGIFDTQQPTSNEPKGPTFN